MKDVRDVRKREHTTSWKERRKRPPCCHYYCTEFTSLVSSESTSAINDHPSQSSSWSHSTCSTHHLKSFIALRIICGHSLTRNFRKPIFLISFARARSTSSWGRTPAHLSNARYDRLGATLSLVFSEARMSVKASATKSQSSNARSVMLGWESKTRMKIPHDAMN